MTVRCGRIRARTNHTCVYCRENLQQRYLEPAEHVGWKCRSITACRRRQNAAGRDNLGR